MTDLSDRTDPRVRRGPEEVRAEQRAARSRRRFARRQWRRRFRVWRLLLVVLLLAGLVAGAVWAVWFSSWLSVTRVEVRGEETLPAEEVVAAAQVPLGGPLATADLEAVRLRVGSLALVRDVEVTRSWPDTVVVEVAEREPVAVVQVGDQLRGLDADGTVLTPLGPDSGLPRVQTTREVSSEALAEAATVVDALPDALAAAVDHVEVETVDQITLQLRAGGVVRWGSAEASGEKAEVLAALLRQGGAAEYDVSVPGLPTTRG